MGGCLKDFPRFSGFLRSSTDLESKLTVTNEKNEFEVIKREWESYIKTQMLENPTLYEVLEHMPADRRNQIQVHMQKLLNLVQECVESDEQPQLVEHVALFLFWLMLEQKLLTEATTIRVHSIFGTIFENKLEIIHQTVCSARELLEDGEVQELKEWNKELIKKSKNQQLWGEHIKVKFKPQIVEDVKNLVDLTPTTMNFNASTLGFSMQWPPCFEELSFNKNFF